MGKIFIYGQIGKEVKASEVVKQIASDPDHIEVYINSPGGNVYEGVAIYNQLQKHGNVSTFIDGLAYSAASWIALAAPKEKRFMSPNAQFGIHQAINFGGGNKDELQAQIEVLNRIDRAQIELYQNATELNSDEIKQLMKRDQPLDFTEALALGFVSGEHTPSKIAALFTPNKLIKDMDLFKEMSSIFNKEAKEPGLIKEEVQKEAEENLQKAESVNEQLHAQFADRKEVEEIKAMLEPFTQAIIEKWNALPTQKDIDASIDAKVKLGVAEALAAIKSKGSIPAPEETAFAEAKKEESFEPLTLKKSFFELKKDIK